MSCESRLQKLLHLLENAVESEIRDAAAQSIRDVAITYPLQLPDILVKVRVLLRNKKWDCRCSAATTLGLLADYFRHHTIADLHGLLHLENTDFTPPRTRKLKSSFSMDGSVSVELVEFAVEEILAKDGILVASNASEKKEMDGLQEEVNFEQSLSARERNRLKRKLRSSEGPSNISRADSDPDPSPPPATHAAPDQVEVVEATESWVFDGVWPFWKVHQSLLEEVLDPVWEVRHGAVLGLRELLSRQCECAGIEVNICQDYPSGWAVAGKSTLRDIILVAEEMILRNEIKNRYCLEVCCVKLIELLILDRMGDFLSDQMVAPVRETAAQAFGACLTPLPLSTMTHLIAIIQKMIKSGPWEVRHSGFLLLKQILLKKTSLEEKKILGCVLEGLNDSMDDVRAAAADVLVPIAPTLNSQLHVEELTSLRELLWMNLAEVDDLSAATPSILHLLWRLYLDENHPKEAARKEDLSERICLLFPFLDHQMTAVRTSAIQCFTQLLISGTGISQFFCKAACFIFFNLLTETKETILHLNEVAWIQLMNVYNKEDLIHDFEDSGLVYSLFKLGSTPIGVCLDPDCLSNLKNLEPNIDSNGRYVVGSQFAGDPHQMRFTICRALSYLFQSLRDPLTIIRNINTSSATVRIVVALIDYYWHLRLQPNPPETTPSLLKEFHSIAVGCTEEESWNQFSELTGIKRKFLGELSALVRDVNGFTRNRCISYIPEFNQLTTDKVEAFIDSLLSQLDLQQQEEICGLQQHVMSTVHCTIEVQRELETRLKGCIASSQVNLNEVPQKLNGVVQPLMGGIRMENAILFQRLFAEQLASFIILCHHRKTAVNRMLNNICSMVYHHEEIQLQNEDIDDLVLIIEQQGLDSALQVATTESFENRPISKRGADFVLQFLAKRLKSSIFQTLPALWTNMTEGLYQDHSDKGPNSLEIITSIGPYLDASVLEEFSKIVSSVCQLCLTENLTLCIYGARCCARLVSSHTDELFPLILSHLTPSLAQDQSRSHREGALITLHHILESLGSKITPYVVLLVVPLLSLMSDYFTSIQTIAASCFGKLISYLPLVIASSPPLHLSPTQQSDYSKNSLFVKKLLDNKKTMDLDFPDDLGVDLRDYQKEGIGWMMFLRQFGLHGILADDMGLGKTIQTLLTVLLSRLQSSKILPSLVVCPATLVSHWQHESLVLLPSDSMKPLSYIGTLNDRIRLRDRIHDFNLVLVSYETLRIDVEWLTQHEWDYCILDEGHIIRNYESKIWKACKRVNARHRLVLSGTPVQNGVLELWALFDFLMPGFLGTRKDFTSQYGKAVDSAKYAKKGSTEATSGILAVNSLHKRVTPFILRRTKDEVLSDLPPKIIQDIYCDLSHIQKLLYEDFANSQKIEDESIIQKSSFQSLQYLSRLCSHPMLAVNWSDSTHRRILSKALGKDFETEESCKEMLSHISHAPKLHILHELFNECGILNHQTSPLQDNGVSCHRMLIFTQLRDLLTLVEQQLLYPLHIPYLRLDGSIPATERGRIVQQFNADPTISVLLLTNKVGGLGLNLTSADVVVFLEHDWNPMNDLQAMDRAHRLGQKRTVNVYRILTRGTLEEKIMSLQSFKLGVANSVVNKDNMSLDSMDTSRLLDLFTYGTATTNTSHQDIEKEDSSQQYEKEFGKKNI